MAGGAVLDAYATANWIPLFSAVLGAAAAFEGLLFVALSINVASIVAAVHLHLRAIQPVVILGVLLLVSVLVLAPQPSIEALGVEPIVLGLAAGVVLSTIHLRVRHHWYKLMPRRFID